MAVDMPALPRASTPATASAVADDTKSARVQVLATRAAARDAVTFVLALPGTQRAPAPYRAGQFITLALPIGGATYYRSYSLCGDGRADAPWEITVKRARGGVCSNALVDGLRPGMILRASLPQGTFTLPASIDRDTPLVFVAAGSGITPIYGMLRALARRDGAHRPRVQLHYAYASPADAIFGRELAALDPEHLWLMQYHYVSASGQRLSPAHVLQAAGTQLAATEWFICGPTDLKQSLVAEAVRHGVVAERVHTEVFASPANAADRVPVRRVGAGMGEPAHVRLTGGATLAAQPGETLLETLERHGYRPDFSCRAGACGTCRMRLLAGQVCDGAGQSDALTPAERAQGYILTCVAQPVDDVTLAFAGQPVAPPRRATDARPAGGRSTTTRATQAAHWTSRKRSLRLGLATAAVGLFATLWGLTSHGTFIPTTGTASTSSSTTTTSSSTTSSSSSTSNSNGSSSFSTQTGQSSPNTSTGVS